MPKVSYHLETDFDPREWTTKTFAKAVKTANQKIAEFWIKELLPKHFTVAGGAEYGYAKRDGGYLGRKELRVGHQKPLVGIGSKRRKSGNAQRMALGGATGKGFPTRITINIPIPDYFTVKKGINKSKELTTISDREATMLAAMHEEFITDFLNNSPKRRRRTKT